MRSESVAWLLRTAGIPSVVLEGGYKAFRTYARMQFDRTIDFAVLGGLTGSAWAALFPSTGGAFAAGVAFFGATFFSTTFFLATFFLATVFLEDFRVAFPVEGFPAAFLATLLLLFEDDFLDTLCFSAEIFFLVLACLEFEDFADFLEVFFLLVEVPRNQMT